MNRIFFYFQYAARNLWRNRQWSAFAAFSVAAGVATVVALRSLGLAVGDSLTSNVRASNHGDITISRGEPGFFDFENPKERDGFSETQVAQVQDWVAARGGTMTAYTQSGNVQLTALDFNSTGRPQFITTLFIDPATFPPTNDILALEPSGVRLGDLFQGGNEVVVSENLAQSQGIAVGDKVRVSGTEEEFLVRGIAPTTAEAGLRNLFAAFFGFAYFDKTLAGTLPVSEQANAISLILPDGTSWEEIQQAADELNNLVPGRVRTLPQLMEQNQKIADVLGSFIVVLGLGALLIGGVGIINTMLVMVRRRMNEIAALKTFGLKGRQIAILFMAEGLLLGIVGSIFGGILGVLLSTIANAYGATLIQQPLVWRIYPEAIGFGLVLGLVITVVFGVLPVLTAVKVRPAIILRPNETHIARAGIFNSLLALLIVVIAIGIIAGQILAPSFAVAFNSGRGVEQMGLLSNPHFIGIVAVAITLLILGLLVCILWVVVWILGKLPAFGWVDLRLAQRNLATRRIRTATTLLALSAGMFALSSIAFFGAGVREILQQTLSDAFGGNVLIFAALPSAISQPMINLKLNTLDGVKYRTQITNYSGEIVAVGGRGIPNAANREEIRRQMREARNEMDFTKAAELAEQMDRLQDIYLNLVVRETDNPNLESGKLWAGRDLTLEDRGKQVAVIKRTPLLVEMGAGIGETLTFKIGTRFYEFEIVGFLPDNEENFQASALLGDVMIPPDSLEGVSTPFQLNVIQVDEQNMNTVLLGLSSLPLVYAVDITYIDGVMSRFIDQMSAIPILVGLLSLGAAATIMANTVALATLERRRQIGVLKAIGLKGRRVMRIMLLENTLVTLVGAVLGLGLSGLGVVIMTSMGLQVAILIPRDALPVAIALVAVAVFIGWLATFLSARVTIRERVLNVLRYE